MKVIGLFLFAALALSGTLLSSASAQSVPTCNGYILQVVSLNSPSTGASCTWQGGNLTLTINTGEAASVTFRVGGVYSQTLTNTNNTYSCYVDVPPEFYPQGTYAVSITQQGALQNNDCGAAWIGLSSNQTLYNYGNHNYTGPTNNATTVPPPTYACGNLTKIYVGHGILCSGFIVNLTALGSNSVGAPAIVNVSYNGAKIKTDLVLQNKTTYYAVHGSIAGEIYINQTQYSINTSNEWAEIRLNETTAPSNTAESNTTTSKTPAYFNVYITPDTTIALSNSSINFNSSVDDSSPPYLYRWYEEKPSSSVYTEISSSTCYQDCNFTLLPPRNGFATGEYYFKLVVNDSSGNSGTSQPVVAFVVNSSSKPEQKSFNLEIQADSADVGLAGGVETALDLEPIGTTVNVNVPYSYGASQIQINSTGLYLSSPAEYTSLLLLAINLTPAPARPLNLNLTTKYNCSIEATRLAIFILDNGTWVKDSNAIANPSLCTITYTVPSDPVVGLFETNYKQATNTTANTTSVSSNQSTSGSATSSSPLNPIYYVGIAVVIVLVIILLLSTKKKAPPTVQEESAVVGEHGSSAA